LLKIIAELRLLAMCLFCRAVRISS